jgi:hypothetical protein
MQMTFFAMTKSSQRYESKRLDTICRREFLEFGTMVGDTPGVLYRCEYKGVARQEICKCMKIMEIKIDAGDKQERGIRKLMKTKGERNEDVLSDCESMARQGDSLAGTWGKVPRPFILRKDYPLNGAIRD